MSQEKTRSPRPSFQETTTNLPQSQAGKGPRGEPLPPESKKAGAAILPLPEEAHAGSASNLTPSRWTGHASTFQEGWQDSALQMRKRSKALYCKHLGSRVDGEQGNRVHAAGRGDVEDGPPLPMYRKKKQR